VEALTPAAVKEFEGSGLMMRILIIPMIFCSLGGAVCEKTVQQPDASLKARAVRLARESRIIDTHIDLPYRLLHEKRVDVSVRTADGDFDYPRAREGGLAAAFMSIYVPSSLEGTGKAKPEAENLIGLVWGIARRWPNKFAVVTSVSDVLRGAGSAKVLLAMGMENGSPIEGNLDNLRLFYDRGIRYITLTHAKSNHICDSSYDPERKWNGLSPFGREVVLEMNRLGIMVDISHVTDSTFFQVVRLSRAPVIASHSSCRYFTPGFERNMSDEMIRELAAHGGVIQINFGSSFINDRFRKEDERETKEIDEHLKQQHLKPEGKEAKAYASDYQHSHPKSFPGVAEVAVHIGHVVKLAGVDHVGLGSDFDGVGDTLPIGLKDVSQYPALLAELLKLGYSEADIMKICSGNILRVWSAVEKAARQSGERQ
jgi:membrane dipeptidase